MSNKFKRTNYQPVLAHTTISEQRYFGPIKTFCEQKWNKYIYIIIKTEIRKLNDLKIINIYKLN